MTVEQLITFIGNHWMLSAALVAVLFMLGTSFFGSSLRGYAAASPSDAIRLINHDDAVVVDVREDREFNQGHILNSIHIPQGYLKDRVKELDKYKGKPIIVGCRSGHRSSHACAILKKEGFEPVYNLAGGVMAWQNANLPLVKK